MTLTKEDMEAALIDTLKKYGVTISTQEIPQVLALGADTFLLRKGLTVPEKHLSELYLIINEMRG